MPVSTECAAALLSFRYPSYMLYLYFLGLFRLHARSLMTMFVCYNFADKFLHLYIETHVSQRLSTLAEHSSIMEELLTSFGAQYGVKFLGETKLDFWPNRL